MVKSGASRFETRAATDPMLSTTQAADAASLKAAIDKAREKATAIAVNAESATGYAKRSAELLARLAINRNQVLDLSAAQPVLLNALNDARTDIVRLPAACSGGLTVARRRSAC